MNKTISSKSELEIQRGIRLSEGDLKTTAGKIAIAAAKPNEKKRVWMELIRRYLGYGARYLKYLNSTREG